MLPRSWRLLLWPAIFFALAANKPAHSALAEDKPAQSALAANKPAQSALAAEKPAWPPAKREAVERWQEMRLGMFIHWGPVSLKGTEIGWSRGAQVPSDEYDDLYKQFNAERFDADQWVAIAKAAGMKYIVLTTKHHDGFCLWDTRLTDYNVMRSPLKRDVVKELAAACKKQGLAFGAYYSVCDWHHPDFPLTSPGGKTKRPKSDIEAYNRYLLGQIRELVTNYGPLLTIWNDMPQEFRGRGAETIRMLRELQPDILVNNRTGDGGDYDTPEQQVGKFQMERPWETCMTLGTQWAWKPNDRIKSLKQCLQTLISCAGGDGNLLFNVGPMPTGAIEARQVERLTQMGAWIKKYGETIYGTRGGPYMPTRQMAATRKGNTIYLHLFSWTGDTVKLLPLPAKIVKSLAVTGGEVAVTQSDTGIEISLPQANHQAIDTIIALELDKPAIEIKPLAGAGEESPPPVKKAPASNKPAATATGKYADLDPHRVEAIAGMIEAHARGFGPPASDRRAWQAANVKKLLGSQIPQAERLLREKFPAWDDNAYLDFSRTGKRPRGEAMLRARARRLDPLVIAECLEGRGRFLPAIQTALHEYVLQPTWTLPAHDGNLKCFYRQAYTVDLGSSAFALELAQTLYLLGNALPPATRQEVMAALETRIFAPMEQSLRSNKGPFWLRGTNNWNAVCLAGVVGAAQAALDDRARRAEYLAAGEYYSRFYLSGFGNDGYCLEGIGYWDYGFSHFILLREELLHATAGRIDLFSPGRAGTELFSPGRAGTELVNDPKVRNIALFGPRIEITDGVYPAFGDCHLGTRPDSNIMAYCDHTLSLGLKTPKMAFPTSGITGACMTAFPGPVVTPAGQGGDEAQVGLRSWFADAGVLVCRPAPGSGSSLGICIKAGGNGSHSHNDAGSFAIACDGAQPVGDPGGPRGYQRDTFGPNRYNYKLFNSFGHPVPVVAGQLQVDATKVHPKVLSHQFSDAADELVIDLTRSYAVPELKRLVRTMRYERAGRGAIVLEDSFSFAKPSAFELGLPAHAAWQQVDARTIEFRSGKARLEATIDSPDGFDVVAETIEENCDPFPRLGIRLKKPVSAGAVRVTFRPK
jgi:alpha-L-fucosidase